MKRPHLRQSHFLSFKGMINQRPQAWSPRRNAGPVFSNVTVFSLYCGYKTTIYCDSAQNLVPCPSAAQTFWEGPVIACGCFIPIVWQKYRCFLHFFRRWAQCLGPFIGYSFGISRKKTSTIFYDTAFGKYSRIAGILEQMNFTILQC